MKLLLALLLSGCCGLNVVVSARPMLCESNRIRYGTVPADWAWLNAAVDAAVRFWSTKGVCFEKTSTQPEVTAVVVYDLPNGRAGSYSYVPPQVKLDSSLEGQPEKSACVAAHELGHHIGLGHVSTPGSVMAPGVGCSCVWSAADEAELRRVRP